jgi:hypothetical protein
MSHPFRYDKASPEIIRLAAMLYVRFTFIYDNKLKIGSMNASSTLVKNVYVHGRIASDLCLRPLPGASHLRLFAAPATLSASGRQTGMVMNVHLGLS